MPNDGVFSMTNFIKTQNSFSHGEVAPEFYSHDDINGLSYLKNLDVLDSGALTRRYGLCHVANLSDNARLIPFSVSETENYILALGAYRMWIYNPNGSRLACLNTSWSRDNLPVLQYAQRFDSMIFVHPDVPPQILTKTETGFKLNKFVFDCDSATLSVFSPFMRFDDTKNINITVSSSDKGNNYAVFTTCHDFWQSGYVGVRILLNNKQWIVHRYISPTQVLVYTNGGYTLPNEPINDWAEETFSPVRGWPVSITFHQDRLVFGGSRGYPAGVWMSQVAHHKNFDIGTGLDDEAIFLTLLSQQRQQICTVVSSDNLQILTSVGEWSISSKPLTPSSIDIKQHTSVGSFCGYYLPPQKIEGSTVFISNNLNEIRELVLDELGEKYNATDLCAFAKHLMVSPIDIAYNASQRKLFVIMSDGKMAVLNKHSALGINAWGRYETCGDFKSVSVIDGVTYVVVNRSDKYSLEKFSPDATRDVNTYDFTWRASALPFRAGGHNPTRIRIRKITARIWNTKSIFINGVRADLPNSIYSDSSPGFSGDVYVNALGTLNDMTMPGWTIHSDEPYPSTILSINITGCYSV